jgi:hypothetical protein
MSTAAANQDFGKLYWELRSFDLKSAKPIEPKKGDTDVLQGKDPKRVAGALSIISKMAQQYDENTFVEAMKTGDLPPMKLTPHEMEIARGGIGITGSLLIGVGVGLLAGAAFKWL